ncbi:hypothetical protein DXD68_23880 [Parabacteroides sp. TM07-1AC]|uniref:DUF6383 domain-containing protein n=1 Tax=Parabacteroides sp. TM07-1AC TaxID=2292363 RepID=UPI000EFF90C0|nr:DUF6383 domain-containing protein [Parabacteroides sp. TM07-1AC]RHU21498.1 hypothetical protein DXD68_23880 [Parabacteroides sp. TM07-1AC]
MNKKFSTLVAALLASGGLFYAVDAMILPASNGVANTFVGAAMSKSSTEATAAKVVACNFKIESEFTKAWKVKKVEEAFYLEVNDAEGWILCEGAIQEIKGSADAYSTQRAIAVKLQAETHKLLSGEKEVVIDPASGAISLTAEKGEGNAYLYSDAETVVGELQANAEVALSTQKTEQVVGTNDVKWTETDQSSTVAANEYDSQEIEAGEKWTAVVGDQGALTLKAGKKFLKAPTSAGNATLEEEGSATAITLNEDGALKSGDNFLVNSESTIKTVEQVAGEKLYLFTEAGELVTSKDAVKNGDAYLIAELKSSTSADKTVGVEVITADPTEPGSSVDGMTDAGVYVKDGKIELVGGTASTNAIPAPFAISSSNTGLKELAGQSWTLVEGELINLAAEKAGKAEKYLGKFATKAADPTYTLVKKENAITGIAYTKSGLVIEGQTIAADLKTTGEALPLVVKGQLTSVNSGDIVTIKDASTSVNDQWKIVIGALSGDNFNYSFVKCDKFGKEVSPKTYLKVGEESDFTGKKYDGSFSLQTKDGSYLEISNGALAKAAQGQPSLTLFAYAIQADAKSYTVGQLLNDFGSRTSFGVALAHKYIDEDGDAATKDITTGNVFADADLVPVKYDGTNKKLVELTGDANASVNEAILLKSGDRYIVLETTKDSEWTSIKDDLKNGGYKFTTLGEKAMLELLANTGEFNKGTYAPYFQFYYDNATNVGGKGKAVYNIEVKKYDKSAFSTALYISSFEVKTGAQKGVYLTVTNDKAYWVAAELGLNNLVKAKSDDSPLNYTYVNIEFANHPSVKDNNGKILNGRVLGANLATADKSEFLFSKPEGQWIVNVGGQSGELNKKGVAGLKDATKFTFVNRESGKSYTVNAMYYLGDNKYAVSPSQYASSANRDTLVITGIKEEIVAGKVQRDGYADLKTSDVQDEQFRLLVASAEEDYYVGENHTAKSHFLGLSHDEAAAVNWRIVPLTGAREYDKDGILKTASDSIYAFRYSQYFKDDKLFSKNDTIAIVGYALQNTANDEYLTYENPQTTTIQSMICDPNFTSFKTTKNVSEAYRFALKEKGTDLYNIIGVNTSKGDTSDPMYDKDGYLNSAYSPYFVLNLGSKLYGATTLTKQGAVEVDGAYVKINSNDLFKVQKVGAPEYRLQSMGDTIRIFRQENDYDQMFENGEFLNIGNKAQLTTMAPALYVDTAYVKRGNNNRYQYLLAVNPEYKPATFDNANHQLTPDTTYGRFLVNLIDTAYVAYVNGAIHTNKYINDNEAGEHFAKLGFVYGFRTGDKLYITDKNYTKSGKASDVIDLSTSDFNTAKFAFRYINPINHESDGSFKVQTGYYDYNTYIAGKKQPEVANDGYLKNINGVVVVAKGYAAGDQFDLAAEHSNPTANGEISASEVIVSTIDGAVVVKGAEGKNVVITNVLGQTIANTVITSSEATIATPAGVVVVAVEGEAAVKAIVK